MPDRLALDRACEVELCTAAWVTVPTSEARRCRERADRLARVAVARTTVVAPGQRRLLRRAARLRPDRARHPAAGLPGRPLRHPRGPLRHRGPGRRRAGRCAGAPQPAAGCGAEDQEEPAHPEAAPALSRVTIAVMLAAAPCA